MTVIFILNRSCKQYKLYKRIYVINFTRQITKIHSTKRVQVKLNTDYIKSKDKI